ncbi:divalent cation tolerance protein CutA [Vibrio sp. SCSIO 43136]|uniref:divalent cation tolerance protein CutA n=1 Tax=Vibrio sp. SCSIO 43136 TaxID=2819101 RepID=UPI002075F850|nr:divalent cation tolerance protein CutA [Vibrio sp. SCSIO 43136]USD66984.1 divalent cation tolerance protein CutA [Vibrio sp. SCSIO 43136]
MEYKLEIYCPASSVIPLRDALNEVGAGVVGHYDSVMSVIQIQGFWRPTDGANPVTGEKNVINSGEEVRLDVRCHESLVKQAIAAIRQVHPYEEPAINIVPLANHHFGL